MTLHDYAAHADRLTRVLQDSELDPEFPLAKKPDAEGIVPGFAWRAGAGE